MDTRRNEIVAQRIHKHERCHLGRISKIVSVYTLGQGGTGSWLHGYHPDILTCRFLWNEGKSKTGKVAAAAAAAYKNVWFLSHLFELLLNLKPDDRLMCHYMVKDTAEGIFGIVPCSGIFHRFTYGHTQTARR